MYAGTCVCRHRHYNEEFKLGISPEWHPVLRMEFQNFSELLETKPSASWAADLLSNGRANDVRSCSANVLVTHNSGGELLSSLGEWGSSATVQAAHLQRRLSHALTNTRCTFQLPWREEESRRKRQLRIQCQSTALWLPRQCRLQHNSS